MKPGSTLPLAGRGMSDMCIALGKMPLGEMQQISLERKRSNFCPFGHRRIERRQNTNRIYRLEEQQNKENDVFKMFLVQIVIAFERRRVVGASHLLN